MHASLGIDHFLSDASERINCSGEIPPIWREPADTFTLKQIAPKLEP